MHCPEPQRINLVVIILSYFQHHNRHHPGGGSLVREDSLQLTQIEDDKENNAKKHCTAQRFIAGANSYFKN